MARSTPSSAMRSSTAPTVGSPCCACGASTGAPRPRSPRASRVRLPLVRRRASTECRREGRGDDPSGDTSSPVQPTETTYGAAGSEGRFQVFARVQSTDGPLGPHDQGRRRPQGDPGGVVGPVTRARTGTSGSAGDVRLRLRRPPRAASPLSPVRVRGPPAAQGLPVVSRVVSRGPASSTSSPCPVKPTSLFH